MAFWLTDKERGYFGLGWEYRRRNRPITDNPFTEGHWGWDAFRDGYLAFKPSATALYDDDQIAEPER